MSRNEAQKIAKKYKDLLKQDKFLFSQMYLFGSYAKGEPDAQSDIDIAIVAKGDSSKNYLNKKMRLWELAVDVDSRIEPVLLDEKEITRGAVSILGAEVKKYGVLIA